MKTMLQAVLVVVSLVGAVSLTWANDDVELQREEAELNIERGEPAEHRTESLAKQFNVETSQVDALRSKTGWGGTTIQLAMAENLVKTDPVKYPTMTDALNKVTAMRAEGKGYGAISKELGFKLGPVISSARHTRNEMRREGRAEHMEQGHKHDHQAKPERVPKMERHERPPKAERMERPPKPEKPSKP
jgi:hypothetical protein